MLLDAALFVALLIASHPAWTGISLHEWLAVLVFLPVLYHLAINWDWVVGIASRLFAKLKSVSRVDFAVDIFLFLATVTVMLSGVMVIPGVVPVGNGTVVLSVWREAHRMSSDMTVVAMTVHLLLHARWMLDVAVRNVVPRPGRHAIGQPAVLARVRGRR